MMWKKKLKEQFAEKVIVCLKGLKGAPSKTQKKKSSKCFKFFSSIFMKNAFAINSRFFAQKYARNKKERNC